MGESLLTYDAALAWVDQATAKSRTLLLGNGFSVAYDASRFTYRALRETASNLGYIGGLADKFFNSLNTYDFELVIRQLLAAANALEVLDEAAHADEIAQLRAQAADLKDGLARTLAGLHPERPGDISDAAYARVRAFIEPFGRIYSANYDLLLYWTTMHDDAGKGSHFTTADDGFRNPDGPTAEYVVWNYLDPHAQTIYYLHGALHLYRDIDNGELQKLTWVRTGEPLIEQIRRQLAADRFPLIVAEGSSNEKLARIQTSDYLARGLRSLAAIGGSMVVFGLSMSANDAHILKAVAASKVSRLAVSVYGDLRSDANRELIDAALHLKSRRAAGHAKVPLEVRFFDATTVPLWKI
ncbi:DUF4917 family protein [Leifsonia sp. 71-9]|uniref:DUF4917 family protein n=1 Tax=Leifsonia sp. 71-9 TaxID=1895934 RepID=UPI00092B3A63|nr:DUF4917 family protein [Leifsonia sp. 71-9]OJX75578.1 MAG: hypothetical protein BGO91_20095 [Leifsonia sp. 71-9]